MKQYKTVIKIMQENGGYATLGYLNQNVLKIKDCEWKTKTPFASIRRIVQDDRFFFKIRPGLWALKEYKDKLPREILQKEDVPIEKKVEYSHTFYQGLLVEIGNINNYQTFVPNQDKNKIFLNKKLGEIAKLTNIYQFSYNNFVQRVKTIDVVWFNNRNMPSKLFEVEHSTDFERSFIKFAELQDFYVELYIVADRNKKREYENRLNQVVFNSISRKIKFIDYEKLSEWHTNEYKLYIIRKQVNI